MEEGVGSGGEWEASRPVCPRGWSRLSLPRGRELREALISQPRGEEPGDLTPAAASAAINPGPLAVRCLPSSRGGWSGPSPNLRKDEALGVAL